MSARRNVPLERAWLASAERRAGHSAFAGHVSARLEMGAALYGDRWTALGIERLLDELREEAADLGGWGVLARQALVDVATLDPSRLRRVEGALQAVIVSGAQAHRVLARARDELQATSNAPVARRPHEHRGAGRDAPSRTPATQVERPAIGGGMR